MRTVNNVRLQIQFEKKWITIARWDLAKLSLLCTIARHLTTRTTGRKYRVINGRDNLLIGST